MDLRPFHRHAVLASVDAVAGVTPDHLTLATPCAGWTLDRLLSHMTVQHLGFAASARGAGNRREFWNPDRVAQDVAADPEGTYTGAAHEVLAAFAEHGVLESTFALPEFGEDAAVPGGVAIAMHFVDYVAHGWDVARTLSRAFTLPDEVVAAALSIALAVPDDESRSGADAVFGPAASVTDEATDLDRFLAHLGRSPRWPA